MNKFTQLVSAASFCASLVLVASPALAGAIHFEFGGGPGITGQGTFTIQPNVAPADPNPNCGTAGNDPCRTDPVGAYRITNISGTFSAAFLGITNAAITGLVPISPANQRGSDYEPMVPSSLSFIDNADGSVASYDNLFYPNGSPIVCDFPFVGTFVDVFGVAFTIEGGYTVALWGDGNLDFGPLTYGVSVSNGEKFLYNQFAGITATAPEPTSLSLLIGGLLMVSARLKRTSRAKV